MNVLLQISDSPLLFLLVLVIACGRAAKADDRGYVYMRERFRYDTLFQIGGKFVRQNYFLNLTIGTICIWEGPSDNDTHFQVREGV